MSEDRTLPFDLPFGARPAPDGGFEARIWAPLAGAVSIVLLPGSTSTRPASVVVPALDEGHGVWTAELPDTRHGDRYLLRLDGTDRPDPWARSQPDGSTGASALVDPAALGAVPPGRDDRPARPDPSRASLLIYELHVGCFSEDGTFDAAIEHLAELVDLGVTHVELLPVNQFPGDHGWGYDGIFWSAAHHAYGGPAGLVRLVDAAHRAGLGVILDVVYNHLGPTGDQIYDAHGPFLTDRHRTPWGRAVNVDGRGSGAVRETILQSAEWWVGEIGVDGLRVDACHAIVDQSARSILAELTDRVRVIDADVLLIAESGRNDPHTVRPTADGGWGFDADWADDFHHALRTLLTDDRQGWYADFGQIALLAKAFDRPYVHDGTWSGYRERRFGAPPTGVDRARFVVFDQNHDQVGNRPMGDRLPGPVRPLAALCLLFSPSTPLLFMGEEYGEDAPFQFFSDHRNDFIADATRNGRRAEFADFTAATGQTVPDPQDEDTFDRSKLTRIVDHHLLQLYRRLVTLRPRFPHGRPVVTFDVSARWLRVERGPFVMLANLSAEMTVVDRPDGRIEVATHPSVDAGLRSAEPHLTLPAWSGVLIERAHP